MFPTPRTRRTSRSDLVPLGGLLTMIMMAVSTTQYGLGALAPALRADLSLTNSQFGLVNSVFFLSVAGFSVIVPKALAHLRERTAIVAVSMLTAGGVGLAVMAVNAWWVVPGLVVAAVATAAANPITNRASLTAGTARELLIAVKQSGVAISTIVCGAVLPPLAVLANWRLALVAYAVGVSAVPLVLLRWATGSRSPVLAARPAASPVRYSIPQVVVYALLMGAGSATVTTYLASYAHAELATDAVVAGLVLSCVGIGAVAGRFLWGGLAVRSVRRGGHLQHQLAVMALIAVVATAGLIASTRVGVALAAVCALAIGLSASSWNPLAMMISTASGDPERTMRTSGLVMFGFFAGLAVGPAGYGVLVDNFGYTVGWSATLLLFGCAGVAMLYRRRAPDALFGTREPVESATR
ncbi:MFS transporter [Rhizomonospora bruguierae]|uniref:MFS transporter n=1 Tax=Rhizomonospora bruguierae TaxID=1581705 RepID=UPI001BD006FE|nr:MFS transporter [Micromonospora sp. NBRC 107566]